MDPSSMQVFWSWGGVAIGPTIVTTWGIMALLAISAIFVTRRLSMTPGPLQTMAEGIVLTLQAAIENVAPGHGRRLLPLIGSLWVYLCIANLIGLIPGLSSPTADLSATAALALLVFVSVHWFGIRERGLMPYLNHYLAPSPIMLPFHLISEITRTVALAVRLFGNIMSLEMAALLILLVAGFLVPIPILMLHVVEALVQAYIFGMLALVYIASGLEAKQAPSTDTPESP